MIGGGQYQALNSPMMGGSATFPPVHHVCYNSYPLHPAADNTFSQLQICVKWSEKGAGKKYYIRQHIRKMQFQHCALKFLTVGPTPLHISLSRTSKVFPVSRKDLQLEAILRPYVQPHPKPPGPMGPWIKDLNTLYPTGPRFHGPPPRTH